MASILDEFKNINFNDRRLHNRFQSILKTLETAPSGVISRAFIDSKDQKAAYRFLDNEKTSFKTMHRAHLERVKERCANHDIILAIQDSTAVSLTGANKVPDIDFIGELKIHHPGLNIHTTILLTPEQEILGIADLHSYSRTNYPIKNKTYDRLPALCKERGKLIRSINNIRSDVNYTKKLIWIADREADFWDYYTKLTSTNEQFVQRVVHQRYIKESEEDYFAYLKKQPIIGSYKFEIDSRGGKFARPKRQIICDVRSAEITLKKPKQYAKEMKLCKVRAIYVSEKESETPLEWFLITNIECNSFEEIIEKVRWYKNRWVIEELHRVVKSGCGIEEMRLENKERLMKYLLLLFVVGTRILWMTKLAKIGKDIPCTEAFSNEEWQILYIRKHKKYPPEGEIPTMKEAVRLLGMLGGFYGYNKKLDPGAMTIWRGMRRLKELIDGIEAIDIFKTKGEKCG